MRSSQQQGAALITALVFLAIMTMLAISALTTTTLEEKMAANAQEVNRMFQAAESGLKMLIADPNVFTSTATTYSASSTGFGQYNAEITYQSRYRQQTPVFRSATPSDVGNAFHHYGFTSTARSANDRVSKTLHLGVYREGPKN